MASKFRILVVLTSIVVTVAVLIIWFTEAQERHRDTLQMAQVNLEHGIQLHRQKQYLPAKKVLIQALRADPEAWEAAFYLGAGNFELKRYNAAIPFLERALFLAPTEQKRYKMLDVIYYKLGQLDMARGYFSAYRELDPDNYDARGMIETMAKLQRSTALAATEKIN